jgi:hypothetical protein
METARRVLMVKRLLLEATTALKNTITMTTSTPTVRDTDCWNKLNKRRLMFSWAENLNELNIRA